LGAVWVVEPRQPQHQQVVRQGAARRVGELVEHLAHVERLEHRRQQGRGQVEPAQPVERADHGLFGRQAGGGGRGRLVEAVPLAGTQRDRLGGPDPEAARRLVEDEVDGRQRAHAALTEKRFEGAGRQRRGVGELAPDRGGGDRRRQGVGRQQELAEAERVGVGDRDAAAGVGAGDAGRLETGHELPRLGTQRGQHRTVRDQHRQSLAYPTPVS